MLLRNLCTIKTQFMKSIKQHLFYPKTCQIASYSPRLWVKNTLFSAFPKSHFNYTKVSLHFVLLSLVSVLLVGCSTSQVVRVPAPLVDISSPYEIQRDWQITLNSFSHSDSEGLYFATDGTHVYFATPEGGITAALKETQSRWVDQIVWQRKFAESIMSGPVLDGEQLIIGTAKGNLMALSKQDGSLIWQTQLSSEVLSKAVIGEGNIFVRTVDGKLVSVKSSSGKVNWTLEHQLPSLSLRGIAPVTLHEGRVYVGWESGNVEAFSAYSGERLWRAQIAIPRGRTDLERMVDIQAALVMRQGRLFVLGYNGQLVSLNPHTGNLFWAKQISGFRDFLVTDNAVYVVDEDDILHAYDLMNGTLIWRQEGYQYRSLIDLVAFGDNQILLADKLGYLHWVDKLSGSLIARAKHPSADTAGSLIVRVHVDGKRLYVKDINGVVTAYTVKPSNWYKFNHPEDPLNILPSSVDKSSVKTEQVEK